MLQDLLQNLVKMENLLDCVKQKNFIMLQLPVENLFQIFLTTILKVFAKIILELKKFRKIKGFRKILSIYQCTSFKKIDLHSRLMDINGV